MMHARQYWTRFAAALLLLSFGTVPRTTLLQPVLLPPIPRRIFHSGSLELRSRRKLGRNC